MRKLLIVVAGVVLVLNLVGVVTAYYVFTRHLAPMESTPSQVNVVIESGMSTADIGALLEERKIIRSRKAFRLLAEYSGLADKLKAGEFELDPSKEPISIIEELVKGKEILYPVTVPEGNTLGQTAEIVAAAGFSTVSDFVAAAKDQRLLQTFGVIGYDAEGYLMPETYRFRKNVGADEIVSKMIVTFFEKVKPLRDAHQKDSLLSFGEVVTMASIVEKETGNKDEYPLIAAVFHNRLKKKMLLQADPTVIYALPNFDGNIRKEDLMYDSPYNTYRYRGLPPGPIANPGVEAIRAVYQPADVPYLYFVAMKEDGRHHFSKTLAEHNQAVRKYQLRRR